MVCMGYLLTRTPCPSLGVIADSPWFRMGLVQLLLHPDDLHGLLKREAPNRRVVTFMRLAFKKKVIAIHSMDVFHRLTLLRRRRKTGSNIVYEF
jgi:hypothetical protein